jgi:sugar phosphate isomerase/epimerase
MVEALKKRQRRLVILTTDVQDASNPLNQRVLRAASKVGLKHYRLGFFRYREDRSIPDQLNEIKVQLRDVAALNQELGLCAGFQNHSGRDYVGAPVWDIYELIKDFDRQQIGVHFDIGHATIEGGNAWRTNARLMTPLFSAVYVKDFAWQKLGESWKSEWCPLGQGMISRSFIATLKKSPFRGPISQHHEYPLGAQKEMITAMQKDLATLKSWLAD